MWPRQDGFYVYIPGGNGGAEGQPSDFYAKVKESLAELGIEPAWSFKYNAGANPIAFPVPQNLLTHSKVIDIMRLSSSLETPFQLPPGRQLRPPPPKRASGGTQDGIADYAAD